MVIKFLDASLTQQLHSHKNQVVLGLWRVFCFSSYDAQFTSMFDVKLFDIMNNTCMHVIVQFF